MHDRMSARAPLKSRCTSDEGCYESHEIPEKPILCCEFIPKTDKKGHAKRPTTSPGDKLVGENDCLVSHTQNNVMRLYTCVEGGECNNQKSSLRVSPPKV